MSGLNVRRGIRITTLTLLTAPLWLSNAARADCAGPSISLASQKVTPEDKIAVIGEFWTDTCDDVGVAGGGCFGTDDGFDEGHPIQNIEITLRPGKGAEPIELGTVDANEDFAFRLEAAVPLLEPGRYRIVAHSADGVARTTLRVLR